MGTVWSAPNYCYRAATSPPSSSSTSTSSASSPSSRPRRRRAGACRARSPRRTTSCEGWNGRNQELLQTGPHEDDLTPHPADHHRPIRVIRLPVSLPSFLYGVQATRMSTSCTPHKPRNELMLETTDRVNKMID